MAKDKNIIVMEDFTMESPSTKKYLNILSGFQQEDKKTLLILADSNENIFLSSRNLKKSKVVNVSSLNTYDLINANKLMFMESSMKELEKRY